MKIYTKTGDKGQTGLLGGVRVSKASTRVEAYGQVDELVSWMGLIRSTTKDNELATQLGTIQLELFFVNSELATPADKEVMGETISEDDVTQLETWIDQCDQEIPPLRSFILPGGSQTASQLQVARTVCRRAERATIRLMEEETTRAILVRYLNRLSDLLFALGRRANGREHIEEIQVSELRKTRQSQKTSKNQNDD